MATFLGLVVVLAVVVYFVNKKMMAQPTSLLPKKVSDSDVKLTVTVPEPVVAEVVEPVKKTRKKTAKKTGTRKPRAKKNTD